MRVSHAGPMSRVRSSDWAGCALRLAPPFVRLTALLITSRLRWIGGASRNDSPSWCLPGSSNETFSSLCNEPLSGASRAFIWLLDGRSRETGNGEGVNQRTSHVKKTSFRCQRRNPSEPREAINSGSEILSAQGSFISQGGSQGVPE